MPKKNKLSTPEWILQGYDSKESYNMQKNKSSTSPKQSGDSSPKAKGISEKKTSAKTFKFRKCPKCDSDDVVVVIGGEEGKGSKGWECKKCDWKGTDVQKQELNEDEMMKYLDEKGEEVT